MNFKFTLWKVIVSIIVLIATDIILASQMIVLDAPKIWHEEIFDPMIVLVSLIAGVLIYAVWSLIQKR